MCNFFFKNPLFFINNLSKKLRIPQAFQPSLAKDYEHHVNYIHFNPVKHGYVLNPSEWKFSSIHRFIKQGILSKNWAWHDAFTTLNFGE